MRRTILAACLALCACAGCTATAPYLRSRAADFVDCLKLEAGYGGAADVELRATDWVSTGLGAASSFRWGFEGRELVGFPGAPRAGVTHHYGFPVLPLRTWLGLEDFGDDGPVQFAYTDVRWREGRFFAPAIQTERVAKSIVLFDVTALPRFREARGRRRPLHAWDVHAGFTLLGSARLGLSPGEMADFVVGWFGRDLAGDDGPGPEPEKPLATQPPGR